MSTKDQPPESSETTKPPAAVTPPVSAPAVSENTVKALEGAVVRQDSGSSLPLQFPEPVAVTPIPPALAQAQVSSTIHSSPSPIPQISSVASTGTPTLSSGAQEDAGDPADMLGLLAERDVSLIAQQFRQSYIDLTENTKKPNVLIVGATGAGKSSLINSVFGKRLAQEGAGVPITTHFNRYAPDDGNVVIYDSRGLEHGNTELFINDTRDFFQGLSAENSIHVVWYVINGAGSRIQPFEEEVCRTLFADIPLIFLINKADISTDEDRSILRETLTQLNLPSCRGIFDTVSGDHPPLLNVTKCTKCGSDDLDIRKKKGIATCLACGETISLHMSTDGLIAKTLETLPELAREAFIAAQTSSCRHKDSRAKTIIRQFYQEASEVRYAKPLLKCIARMLVRLSVLWDFRENGKTLSTELAQDLLRREFSFREKILLFLRYSRGELLRTAAIGIIWNRCLRKIFISIFYNTAVGREEMVNWRLTVQRCFVDMNEAEQAAVEKWLEEHDLDSLLEREMPESPETVIPSPLVPDVADAALRAIPAAPALTPISTSPAVAAANIVPESPRALAPSGASPVVTPTSAVIPGSPVVPGGTCLAVAVDPGTPTTAETISPIIVENKSTPCRVLIPEPPFIGTAATAPSGAGSSCSTGTTSPTTPTTALNQADIAAPAPAQVSPAPTVIVKNPFSGKEGSGPKLDEEDLAELEAVAAKESYINSIEAATDLENARKQRKVTVPATVPATVSATVSATVPASTPASVPATVPNVAPTAAVTAVAPTTSTASLTNVTVITATTTVNVTGSQQQST